MLLFQVAVRRDTINIWNVHLKVICIFNVHAAIVLYFMLRCFPASIVSDDQYYNGTFEFKSTRPENNEEFYAMCELMDTNRWVKWTWLTISMNKQSC